MKKKIKLKVIRLIQQKGQITARGRITLHIAVCIGETRRGDKRLTTARSELIQEVLDELQDESIIEIFGANSIRLAA